MCVHWDSNPLPLLALLAHEPKEAQAIDIIIIRMVRVKRRRQTERKTRQRQVTFLLEVYRCSHPIQYPFSQLLLESIQGLVRELLRDWSRILLRSALESIVLLDRRGVDSESWRENGLSSAGCLFRIKWGHWHAWGNLEQIYIRKNKEGTQRGPGLKISIMDACD